MFFSGNNFGSRIEYDMMFYEQFGVAGLIPLLSYVVPGTI
jgi:hypothetical protein